MHLCAILLTASAAGQPAGELPPSASGEHSLKLARQLLPMARPHRTSRYVVLSDSQRPQIRGAERILEETRRQYDRWSRAMRSPIARPDDRLLCILFHDRADFITFARHTEGLGETAEHVSGYFSSRFDWVVYFDPGGSDDIEQAARSLEEAAADIESARDRGADPDRVEEAAASVDALRAELDAEEHARRTAVTIHEAVHQLIHVGTAFPGRANWPTWLHEGLAVAFETDAYRKPFGPDRDYARRANGFRDALREGRHMPLPAFLELETIDHAGTSHAGLIYDQAGSLVSWLYRRKRSEFGAFLEQAGIPDAQGNVPSVSTLFTEVIGSPADIERRWHADVLRR
ncbi:MAG: DUF1570 domain-containing protein [Phycisphaerales bacterium]|jgi:hypothetical protein|nr:DUF1570 domain-containing protein [Phycisphaerales bacterium]